MGDGFLTFDHYPGKEYEGKKTKGKKRSKKTKKKSASRGDRRFKK